MHQTLLLVTPVLRFNNLKHILANIKNVFKNEVSITPLWVLCIDRFNCIWNDNDIECLAKECNESGVQIAVYYQQGGMDFTYLRLKSFDLEKDFDKNNKYQRLADTTKFAIAVNAVSASDREEALEKLNDMACQRARKNAAFGDYYRVCATVFDGKLIIQMPDGLKRKGK